VSADSPFVIYSPKSTRKLAYFGGEDQLCEALGHDYSGGQDWQPEDRAIDCRGHTYSILYSPTDHFYHIEETAEIWDHSQLLAIALADVRRSKQDPGGLEQRVRNSNGDEKHRVIIEHIGTLPDSPLSNLLGWVIIMLLLLFGAAVFYGAARLLGWFTK
jgi:hypothetical protein